ncbi:motility associated factor glycosyltransferase family protein [Desulfosporosinus metallidurans]|uniref:Motility accessory factor n=1 Tax=Desulfosporosinus metallidurans TaxID=1888891 RepID=A0A1Q8R1R3_9FIRM|nr:6-hydroxymethylpterin diphosphokinase MptE-like protein [Desulfosporosinus metallidurans]OLN33522.1 Motility accessory factor [Desulfosporosinus metallidurans]
MILIDNINLLRDKFPVTWSHIDNLNVSPISASKVIDTKSGMPTLAFEEKGRTLYIHSKYDPVQEAERFVSQFNDVENYSHVMFYGVGLGYHIETFMQRYPNLLFSIYEPNQDIFAQFMANKPLASLPINQLKEIFLEYSEVDTETNLNLFLKQVVNQRVLLITLPSYKTAFKDKYNHFSELFLKLIVNLRSEMNTNVSFEKRWIVNSLLNLPEVLKTPNILHDFDKNKFNNKPAVLVAAGPSLQENIEEVRFIKEKSLAYVFSVGNAIKVLLNHEIYPDLACTYDPTKKNSQTFEKLVQEGITTIPLIFGSSVGFETLVSYPGPKIHMITTQDTMASYFLRFADHSPLECVQDAPSIAVVTLELLCKLGFNPIIFVGQNLAFKNEKYYAEGALINNNLGVMSEEQTQQSVEIEDVYGHKILTNLLFESMRTGIEGVIARYPGTQFVNTTKGGAKINGTSFKLLEEVLENMMPDIVKEDWSKASNDYDQEYLNGRMLTMENELNSLMKCMESMIDTLRRLDLLIKDRNTQNIERFFPVFDREFTKIRNNKFYQTFILPMNRVQNDLTIKTIQDVRFEREQIIKGEKVLKAMGSYIYECKKDLEQVVVAAWKHVATQLNTTNKL